MRRENRMPTKIVKKPFVALRPVPVVLVSCGHGERANIITIAWTGILCSNPPQLGIGVRPDRHSHGLIQETGEFVVNVPGEGLLDEVEYCGFVSGRDADKAALFTTFYGELDAAPMIEQCAVNMACRLVRTIEFETHDVFVGRVVQSYCEERFLTEGKLDLGKVQPLLFSMPDRSYWSIGERTAKAWDAGKALK
jgi:flavin reductase (DIM6/NTAB) family NADH-FMN oxidoreductase RutF